MKFRLNIYLLFISACSVISISYAHTSEYLFTQNKGQWERQIKYKTLLADGVMYFEENAITYDFMDKSYLKVVHAKKNIAPPDFVRHHALKMSFVGASTPIITPEKPSPFYYNYFIGNNKTNWASRVYSFQKISYKNLYPGISLDYYTRNGFMKYDFIVSPNTNPAVIQLKFDGADTLLIKGNNLVARTSIVDLIEQEPYAFQWINGQKKQIECEFKIDGNIVSFQLGKYDKGLELIIDPVLIFSSFTGSTADNFGFTATYDEDKNAYVGGIIFGNGTYPTSVGAYQTSFAGMGNDIGISKFSPDGTALLYSTYIGSATGREAPHSIIVNSLNELFVLGTTAGTDFPTTPGAFQTTFNGGTPSTPPASGMDYPNGSDMVVFRLSVNGDALLASTYVGGSGNDGLNNATTLLYNYGDAFRGEIIVDDADNCIVASCTISSNFPVTAGSFNSTYSGGQEGVIFKMPPALNAMIWSGYYGGNGDDAAYGIQPDAAGNLYVCGGTKSLANSLPQPVIGAFGGVSDGFITKINAAGTAVLTGRLVSTAAYDQVYFVQLDQNENVYVYGQSTGNIPISAGVYNNPNSGQFIQKYSNDLSTLEWSTTIGRGAGTIDISPTAFLVDVCDFVYISGWGGTTNQINPYLATSSTTVGLPITPNSFQTTTDGSDFYIMVLAPDAQAVIYSTFFGGAVSREHVDGGTSRFDKSGIIYQAVCAGCGGNSDFPTSPGAWSNTNNSPNCNLGIFKFGLDQIVADFDFSINLNNCQYPMSVEFTNSSQAATLYFWDFGDGTPIITDASPTHNYTQPGTYTVTLIASDIYGCYVNDTLTLEFTLPGPPELTVSDGDTVCTGFGVQLFAIGTNGATYTWTPAHLLNTPGSGSTGTVALTQDTWFYVSITDTNGCTTSDSVFVGIHPEIIIDAGPNIYTDFFGLYQASASIPANTSILWTPGIGLSCTDCPSPYVFPDNTTTYVLTVIDENGCIYQDSIEVYVSSTLYVPNAFSPNGDGANDLFFAQGRNIMEFEMFIYNRWGEQIFYANDMETAWDGRVKGRFSQLDVYVWVINYKTYSDKATVNTIRGHVTLVR
ncbi:MAG: gliding motility-associated C-terminal domain-containing protein [Flavobacteriales bacterium]